MSCCEARIPLLVAWHLFGPLSTRPNLSSWKSIIPGKLKKRKKEKQFSDITVSLVVTDVERSCRQPINQWLSQWPGLETGSYRLKWKRVPSIKYVLLLKLFVPCGSYLHNQFLWVQSTLGRVHNSSPVTDTRNVSFLDSRPASADLDEGGIKIETGITQISGCN